MLDIEICVKSGTKTAWFVLPTSREEICSRLEIEDAQETFLIDSYTAPFTINETDNINRLNEIANLYEEHSGHEVIDYLPDLVKEGFYSDIKNALEEIDNIYIYHGCNSMLDIAYQFIEESGLLSNIPDNVQRYFNYEAYARDMEIEGSFYFTGNDKALQIP
ncbi:antirestriction protein ArdA [Listeria monocytogenes]|nr:antirestriction protein ArdA [Listeria monocytogenes]